MPNSAVKTPRRRRVYLLLLLVLPVLVLGAFLWMGGSSGVTRADFDRIEGVRSLAEVQQFLGPPRLTIDRPADGAHDDVIVVSIWGNESGSIIQVDSDAAGVVQGITFMETTLFNRIRGMWFRAFKTRAPF